jgi:hypothetical protein
MAGHKKQAPPGYAANYPERAEQCKRDAGYTCQQCGAKHRTVAVSKNGESYMKYASAAHVNHDPWNPDAELICLCNSCHFSYDAGHHAAVRKSNQACAQQ